MNDTLQHLIWGGAPVRFPTLNGRWSKAVLAGSGPRWAFMDHWWQDHKGWMEPRLPEPPSTYFHRQFYATFEDDRAGVLTRELMGVENIMWGSDYPHTEGVWPFSRKQVADNFASIPDADTRKIVHGQYGRAVRFPDGVKRPACEGCGKNWRLGSAGRAATPRPSRRYTFPLSAFPDGQGTPLSVGGRTAGRFSSGQAGVCGRE